MLSEKTQARIDDLKQRLQNNPTTWRTEEEVASSAVIASNESRTRYSREMQEKWRYEHEMDKLHRLLSKPASEMTMYDHYAGQAMQGLIAKGCKLEDVVRLAHDLAYQMATFVHEQ